MWDRMRPTEGPVVLVLFLVVSRIKRVRGVISLVLLSSKLQVFWFWGPRLGVLVLELLGLTLLCEVRRTTLLPPVTLRVCAVILHT